MHKKVRYIALISLVCLIGVLLAGCGTNVSAATPVSADHALTVARTSALAVNRFPAFVKTVDSVTSATKLYDAMQALPRFQGIYNCSADDGLQYQVTFRLQGVAQQPIIVSASGCRGVSFSATDARMTNDAFWSLFAQTLGVSENTLFPQPQSH